MRQFKKTFAAIILTLALSFSALAGEMPCGVAATSDPPQTNQTTEQSTNSSSSVALDPVVETALNLLQSILTLI
jgi:hypothetical protein